MQYRLALLALVPMALGCSNDKTNSCASYMANNPPSASAFCATFTLSKVTATTNLPSWASNCDAKPSMLSKECSCHFTAGAAGAPTSAASSPSPKPTTTSAVKTSAKTSIAGPSTTLKTSTTAGGAGGGGSTPTGLTTTLPSASGTVTTATKPMTISGSFDGGMKLYDRSSKVCQDQTETGEADAMFVLEDGATLSNVIIGPNQAEGVHCKGTCTLNNVWWKDVCEDALTLKQSSGTSYVNGGGAFHASDKVIQFNGFGTVKVKNFYVEDYGKVARSCGNCSNNGKARNLVFDNIMAIDGGVICGINSNYHDTCTITNSCQDSNKSCDRYEGNSNGDEPTKLGSNNDGQYCIVNSFTSTC